MKLKQKCLLKNKECSSIRFIVTLPLLFGLQALCHKEYLSTLENIQTHNIKFTIGLSQFIVKQDMQDQKEDRWSKVLSIRKVARILPQLSTFY